MKRIFLVLLLAIPMLAQQQPGHPGPRPRDGGPGRGFGDHERGPGFDGKWWNNTELAKKLNLTDQQVQQMEKIFQQHRLTLIDQRAAVEKAEVALQPMMESDRPDEAQVLAQIDKVAQARAELEKSNARMLLGIRQVLTADQWKQLKAEMPRPRMGGFGPGGPDNRRERRGPGPDGPQGPPPPQDE